MHICMLLLAKYHEENQPVTGVDLQAITQIRALRDAGHNITVIAKKRTLKSKVHEVIEGIQVYRIGPSGLYWLWTALVLWRLRHDLDVVHILGQRITTYISIFLCHFFGIPTVLKIPITHRQFSGKQFYKAIILKLENRISREASAYIAISTEIADQLVAQGFYPERIKRLPNGVDMKRYFAVAGENTLRDKLGLPTDKKIVLYSGRLISRKGFDLVLAAWPKIYSACSDVHLVVVGGGSDEMVTALKQLDQKMGGGTMTCVGGVANPAPYLAASDLYLFPSRREGLPNALLEAMSCGCACVASDIGGCVDLIIPEQTGLLFPTGDAQAMAEAAIRLLQDESLAQTARKAAQTLIASEYEIHSVAQRLVALYQSLQKSGLASDFTNPNHVLASGKKILLLAPHEDDETLMCAGIIAHALTNGADIKVVVVTNGDNKGREKGIIRMRETIKAMEYLGLNAANIIFFGYGNIKQGKSRFLSLLYDAATDVTLVSSKVGTHSYSIPEIPEYHYQKYGVHARYDRATFRQDLEALIMEFNPDHLFVSSLYDAHPDHVALYRFTVESIINIKRANPKFAPVMHEYIVHPHKIEDYWPPSPQSRLAMVKPEILATLTEIDDYWPTREPNSSPLRPFSKPDGFETRTVLSWEQREIFCAPLTLQKTPRSKNKKYLAISKYRSQRPTHNNNYLYSYVKSDEFFWPKDFANIAFLANVNVSSENTVTNQLGIKAIDGITDGYPRFPANEWVTVGETAGAWIQLSWSQAYTVNKIILYDRPNLQDNITSAMLTFSDGSSIQVGTLPNNGSGYEITFAAKTIKWVKLTVDTAVGKITGLSEFEVYEAPEEDNTVIK
jgi:glycosyltransferase involved in cell wall biosynthesis/LmbE family N-acetylglucosaminyl deacetylase